VPAQADQERILIAAEAERQRQVLVARGEAQAILARMRAEAEGLQTILDAKAEGYEQLVQACRGSAQSAASFLIIEKLVEVASVQTEAIRDLPIDKITVWDSGDGQGLSGLGKRLVGVVPPMHDVAKMAGLDLPEYLGKMTGSEDGEAAAADETPSEVDEVDTEA